MGLTPTVDEHSIKVEGTGSSAIITDIAVELLPNREIFQDIYPDSDAEDEEEEDDDDSKSDEEGDEEAQKLKQSLETVREKLTVLRDEQQRSKEFIASAASRLKLLDSFGDTLNQKNRGIAIDKGLETYRMERERVFADHMDGTVKERKFASDIAKLLVEERRVQEADRKRRLKVSKAQGKIREAKQKLKEKEQRRRAEAQKEKDRIRKEREQFWPRSCYTVRITLDAANFTPGSSRRASIASASDLVAAAASDKETFDPESTCDISLSYVTSSAWWSPSYDLALSTTSNTAKLCFDASMTNMTSEAWSSCKIILSTSQTTFSSLGDLIPTLKPWHVKLTGKSPMFTDDILDSREERAQKDGWNAYQNGIAQKPRAQLFGVSKNNVNINSSNANSAANVWRGEEPQLAYANMPLAIQSQQIQSFAPATFGAPIPPPMPRASIAPPLMRSAAGGSSKMAKSSALSRTADGALFGGSRESRRESHAPGAAPSSGLLGNADTAPEYAESADGDEATILEASPEISFQESSFEETGLTATYDLPGAKTLKPSSTASKQRVAHVSFSNVFFSRTVVAKYKPVAYLKAKLRNTSKLTLLKGPTGLTLDGTFMGRSTLPRCSAGEIFSMSLGVDPAIRVSYPKPEVKRSTAGLFTKEESSVYTRTITLLNSRASSGQHVNVTVLDQVPVSEDEKLRVSTLYPRGMSVAGPGVLTGASARENEREWGRATATLKKAGEIVWDVALNAGRGVKLTLEYEIAVPTGEHVIQC